jgi:hypothetical protein
MQPLIQYYYDYFINEKNDGYSLLVSSVCLKICGGLYDRFIMDSIKPIEMITDTEKRIYWEQAKRFYSDETTRVKAMKACYVLVSITGKTN